MNERYEGIVDNFNSYSYHFLGCGAIGSAAATQIVRMGAKDVYLYDLDRVSNENIGVSMYNTKHIGMPKVDALKNLLQEINPNVSVRSYEGLFQEYDCQDKNIVILGFDSMDSRQDAVKKLMKHKKPDVLIDGRMGAEHYQQYTFKNVTYKSYMKTWYSDEDGSHEPCNAKATSYCSNMSGSWICNTIKKILKEEPYMNDFAFNFPTMALNCRSIME